MWFRLSVLIGIDARYVVQDFIEESNALVSSSLKPNYNCKLTELLRTLLLLLKQNGIFAALAGCLLLVSGSLSAQQPDSTESQPNVRNFLHNIFQQVKDAVTVSKKDSIAKATVLNAKSQSPYSRYQGKIIRHINTRELGFEKTFTDTTKRIRYFGTRILNALHTDTKDWVIRSNLFFKENTELNELVLSDNERYLRSLNYIQDARILVQPIRGTKDSVDILVITKDLFSITGALDASGINRVRAKAVENNLMGMGQRLQLTALVDKNRQPTVGYEVLYTKNNISNTFINATVGYTLINTGRSTGTEEEKALYFQAERPLFSPYSRVAGGLEISYNHSENFYGKADSLFYDYRYNLYDGWAGYNLGVTKLLNSKNTIRDRSFIAVRYLSNQFTKTPVQIPQGFDPLYNSRQALLAELTLFRQTFVKANYIYGFGTTEDIPFGFNVAVTGGWYKQLDLKRGYFGVNGNYFVTTKSGAFYQYFVRGGYFFNNRKSSDASMLVGTNLFSRLYLVRGMKIREQLRFSYTKQFNRLTFEPLRIDNAFGLKSFGSDSALGKQRVSLYAETVIYTKYKIFGFQIAPFVFADLSYLTPQDSRFLKSDLYSGLGGGLRTRNENLIFNTIELRMVYFPKTAERNTPFKIAVRSNLRFRYNTRYVKAPDIIQLNYDEFINY